ncbi:Flagellar hook protein FlgE [Pseudovibrio axinellae]|uniref:Flagellar hook protein FlgE n=1 Tax=Pseudovibrio axinellae TaxID=989403 RepID=A0A161VB85_9HYPH|nr:flagellar hook-basal body complex protein [Pseudovibrio axinellae]KZL21364.1 Flagellar hook protein FlgE [Pseudovibrio axinellae]SEQ97562.1 flagellar hook protein FlgE [Pseudovibrio axinellae]
MSIYGAINAATTGLEAQSTALENISGNVANSSTTGYKRLDTSFSDLVASSGNNQSEQVAGTVMASSRATNYLAGDITSADSNTYMAINGSGYFLVTNNDGLTQQTPESYYTRAGDFVMDTEGYLVNSAGYFLQGYPINPATGAVGDQSEPIQISDTPMPAEASTEVEYQANLPSTPTTGNYDEEIENSQYVDLGVFSDPDTQTTPALNDGMVPPVALTATDKLADSTQFIAGDTLTLSLNLNDDVTFDIDADTTVQELLDQLNSMHGVTAELTSTGEISISSFDDLQVTQASATPPASLVSMNLTAQPLTAGGTVDRTVVTADKADEFISSSISGGQVTLYDNNGTAINVEMRWALNAENNWTLYYNTDPSASGDEVAWEAISDMTFDAGGRLITPASGVVDVTDLEVNGVSAGDISFNFGLDTLTQYEDTIGTATSIDVEQDGYPSGALQDIMVDAEGNVIGMYSNDKSQQLFKVAIATFSAEQELQRVDGAAFSATSTSGEPDFDSGATIRSNALESSNADIAEEFSKLIITQQAYSANSKVLSTANEMLDTVLNIVR